MSFEVGEKEIIENYPFKIWTSLSAINLVVLAYVFV